MFALNRTKTATNQKLPCILFLLLFIYLFIYYTSSYQDMLLPFTHELPKWVQMIKFLIVCNKVENKVSAPIWSHCS